MKKVVFELDTIKSPNLSNFTELYNFCQARYPKDIWANVDVLYRFVWARSPNVHVNTWKSLKRAVAAEYLLEYQIVKSIARSIGEPWPKPAKGSVLVAFSPYREDYLPLIFPVTNILSEQGVSINILFPRREFIRTLSPNLFHRAHFLAMEDVQLSPKRYRVAKASYSRLSPAVEDLCTTLKLGKRQAAAAKAFFKGYCMDKVLFRVVLKETQPRLLYGLHYVFHRGYLAAIKEQKAEGRQLTNVLIQHGVFGVNSFHASSGFRGADHVLLWGEYFGKVLASMSSVPAPPFKVIGNPKLEMQLKRRQAGQKTASNSVEKTILFASTPDTAFSKGGNARALRLFVRAVRGSGQWRTIYKPHPAEDLEVYQSLIRDGVIETGQVVRNESVHDLISMADVVVGTETTVLPEAIALGTPAIQLLPDLWQTDWAHYGLVGVSTKEELLRELHHILELQAYSEAVLEKERQLSEVMFGQIEGASARIARYLKEMLEK